MNRRLMILAMITALALAFGCDSNDPTSNEQALGTVDVHVNGSTTAAAAPVSAAQASGEVFVTIEELRFYSREGNDEATVISEPTDVNLSGDVLEQLAVPEGTYNCVFVDWQPELTVTEEDRTCTANMPPVMPDGVDLCVGAEDALVVNEDGSYDVFLELPTVSGSCDQDGGPPSSLQIMTSNTSVQFAN
jgi:hypothetical protein